MSGQDSQGIAYRFIFFNICKYYSFTEVLHGGVCWEVVWLFCYWSSVCSKIALKLTWHVSKHWTLIKFHPFKNFALAPHVWKIYEETRQHFRTWVNSRGARKNSWIARGFAREFLRSGKRYRPSQKLKRLSKSCSLHSKNFFVWGVRIFWVTL